MPASVYVRGLPELSAALKGAADDVRKLDRTALKSVGDPVAAEAERQAQATIRNIGGPWSRMRVGVTTRLVYVAPRQRRGHGSSRPNLAVLLLKAMERALDSKSDEVVTVLGKAVDEIGARHGF